MVLTLQIQTQAICKRSRNPNGVTSCACVLPPDWIFAELVLTRCQDAQAQKQKRSRLWDNEIRTGRRTTCVPPSKADIAGYPFLTTGPSGFQKLRTSCKKTV